MFYNTASGELWEGREKGIAFLPVAYERIYVQWHDRDAGGGWVKDHALDSGILGQTKKDDKNRYRLSDGDLIVETAYHYVLVQSSTGRWFKAILPMKSTALKANRRLNDLLDDSVIPANLTGGKVIKAPRWLYPFNAKTWLETKQTNSWWSFAIDKLGPTSAHPDTVGTPVLPSGDTKDLYDFAKGFYGEFKSGLVKRSPEAAGSIGDDAGGGATSADVGSKTAEVDDEIPF
jgi:hypothetical protein